MCISIIDKYLSVGQLKTNSLDFKYVALHVPFIYFCISVASACDLSTTYAFGTSPKTSAGTPTTAASSTASWDNSIDSR